MKLLVSGAVFVFFVAGAFSPLWAETGYGDEKRVLDIKILVEKFYSSEEEGEILEVDSNDDGSIDYLLRTSENGEKSVEILDYAHNGNMDDFYYYDEGVLVRREIDSNSDGKIDIWVYLDEGVYVKKYERDKDFDGKIETVKDYEEEAEERAKMRGNN